MSFADVILAVVCLVVAIGAVGAGVLAMRRNGRRTSLAIGIGAGVAVVGAYLSGIAALLRQAVLAIADWGAGLAAEPSGIPGIVVLLAGVITVVVAIVLARRGRGRSTTSSFQIMSRSKESPRQRRRREHAETKQREADEAAAEKARKQERKQQRKRAGRGERQSAPDQTSAETSSPATTPPSAPPAVTDHSSRPPAPDPGSSVEEAVPERQSDPTASGQLPPMAPGR